jgi:transposase
MSEKPDETVIHETAYCRCCGKELGEVAGTVNEKRQEIGIKVIRWTTEHQSIVKECPACGTANAGDFPAGIKAPVQYGASIKELAGYLSVYQYLPYNRIAGLFSDVFGVPLSEGTVDTILAELGRKAESAYGEIKKRLGKSIVVGSDESGCQVNGEKHWMYIWQNTGLTYIVHSEHRDYATVEREFPAGFPKAAQVSDCYAVQLKTPARYHQLCIAHLLRELANFETSLKSVWSTQLKELLKQALDLKRHMTEADKKPPPLIAELERRLDALLAVDYTEFHPKLRAFIKRIIKHRKSIFTFLYHAEVPPDNNGSERGIRTIKVKVKVSGQFKTASGADRFAKIRSVVDTAIKNGRNVFAALSALTYCDT